MTILKQLDRLRRRERLLSLAWGAARWLAIVVVALTIACSIDWWIDLRRDTPYSLRVAMLVVQIALAATLAVVWLLIPMLRRPTDDELALVVETRRPEFQHGLISAVQLNRPNALVAGMSPELIAATGRQAEARASQIDFEKLAEHKWLKYGAILAAATVAFVVAVIGVSWWALEPQTVSALLDRQLLSDRAIPRAYSITNQTHAIWPIGDPVMITIGLGGNTTRTANRAGEIRVRNDDGTTANYPLHGAENDVTAQVQIPAGDTNFTFEAWFGDGRLKQPGQIQRVPRPAVIRQNAWTLLPPHCGLRPSGQPYAIEQPRGDVVGLPGSSARVTCATQKPIAHAVVELLGTQTSRESGREIVTVAVLRRIPMELDFDKTGARARFDMRPEEVAYRLVVTDENEFANADPPRRGLRIVPEDAPQVTLLPEQFAPDQLALAGAADDFEVEGLPIPLGGSIRVAYAASHPFGLGEARMHYRINEGPWWPFKLTEVNPGNAAGPFDSRRGAFAKSGPSDQVQFHAAGSPDPEHRLSRTEGGGRFDFQTRSIPELKVGDHIEFFVEVTNREPGAPKAGRSETRLKAIVTLPQLVQWIDSTLRQEDRIRQLEQRQKGVFGPPTPPK